MAPIPHYDSHQCGLSFTVPAHKRDLLSSSDFYFSILEHDFLWITYSQVCSFEHHISRTRSRRKFHRHRGIVSLINLDPVQFLESLDSGLHLIRLCRLVPELVYEILSLFYHLLLVFISGNLLLKTLLTKLKILSIRHFVIVDMSHHYLDCTVGDIVKEAPVMRYEQN